MVKEYNSVVKEIARLEAWAEYSDSEALDRIERLIERFEERAKRLKHQLGLQPSFFSYHFVNVYNNCCKNVNVYNNCRKNVNVYKKNDKKM